AASVKSAVADLFGPLVSYLYWVILRPTVSYTAPQSYNITTLCAQLASIIPYFDTLCASGTIDPVRKLTLDAQLALWQSAHNTLLEEFPSICSGAVGTPE